MRAGFPASRSTLLRLLGLLPIVACAVGCGVVTEDRRLTYATVQTLNPGVDSRWVLEEFPQATGLSRRPDGTIERLQYRVVDPHGHGQSLTLHFDEFGVLARKDYSGPLIKPLDPDTQAGRGVTAQPKPR
jgi:hypothetical protein